MRSQIHYNKLFESKKKLPVHKPKELAISLKAYKLLKRILEIDPTFIPTTEEGIWLRAKQMGL